ncbi:IS5-like element ISAba15 family transposase [Acinetobacter baumannii]|uniref:IS5-like element ISAba15 family transposase n=4 Tax=Acinetobacter baumannii TaxID=470 RepID=UPI0009734F14|nr:IS5-like element ISAba15 family transposase [Acinetobacter baumannii]MUR16719.1 IS5-like element ISAba15 family transposase [Acinetobacter baumannii]MUR55601.1 IS5-like element ISAba15 family transposase [Acinetobacter baumannii]MUR63513.1 IS5-like element ISAba15 family transposase [Acinetobacter baumannii]MUR67452.1 IS5-like element ISAba15 family transposase [Acinetobacter baumannii]MUR78465.1 IS5-like element ISAba15 family transposase [Acinetobacter baumannii]
MRKAYPSDISRKQFEHILPILESARKKTKPRTVDLYDVFCGLLYVLRTGCQWRQLPHDFPKWRTVHSYFQKWSELDEEGNSILDQALKKLVKKARKKDKRKSKTSFIIIDAQSVKNTDTAKHKGYDAGKKVSGIKRHIAVDSQGLPHAICITTANITDREGAKTLLRQNTKRLSRVKNVMVDGGYRGEAFANSVKTLLGETVTTEVAKRDELHTFKVIPKRWVVERSFAWLEKNRRLWKNCERLLNSSLQFTNLAFIALLLKRL